MGNAPALTERTLALRALRQVSALFGPRTRLTRQLCARSTFPPRPLHRLRFCFGRSAVANCRDSHQSCAPYKAGQSGTGGPCGTHLAAARLAPANRRYTSGSPGRTTGASTERHRKATVTPASHCCAALAKLSGVTEVAPPLGSLTLRRWTPRLAGLVGPDTIRRPACRFVPSPKSQNKRHRAIATAPGGRDAVTPAQVLMRLCSGGWHGGPAAAYSAPCSPVRLAPARLGPRLAYPDQTQEQLYSKPPHVQILLKAPLKMGPRRLPRPPRADGPVH